MLVVGAVLSALTLRTNREGQITERFTRAIDQLGSKELDVRLGGIYGLERIARDSREDHSPVMEVLTAYVREHAPWPPKREAPEFSEANAAVEASDPSRPEQEEGRPKVPATDVQAALTVIGRRDLGHEEKRVDRHLVLAESDLRQVDLAGANLGSADLGRANLGNANLEKATLGEANLGGANLGRARVEGANLQGANFWGADLRGANFGAADLKGANFGAARLQGANFGGADLRSANLGKANLEGAHLRNANLGGAYLGQASLEGAHFEGADLRRANLGKAGREKVGLGAAGLKGATYDSKTDWPDGFVPEAAGALKTD